jgi:hypothetical protein
VRKLKKASKKLSNPKFRNRGAFSLVVLQKICWDTDVRTLLKKDFGFRRVSGG